MKIDLLHILRVSAFSVGAVALSACTRLAGTGDASLFDEGRRQEPPEEALSPPDLRGYQPVPEMAMIDDLESRIQAVNLELRTLRSALEHMGPLEEGLLDYGAAEVVSDLAPLQSDVMVTLSESTPSMPINDDDMLFEEPPELDNARSLFSRADLGVYPTKAAAMADWDRMEGELDLTELTPAYVEVGGGVQLTTGPFVSAQAAEKGCVDLRPTAGVCTPSAPEGLLQ